MHHHAARFDLRRFHNAVLDAGPLTLPVLGDKIRAWAANADMPPQ